jgi:hypothetical protein
MFTLKAASRCGYAVARTLAQPSARCLLARFALLPGWG